MGSTIGGISILKSVVFFFGLKNKGRVLVINRHLLCLDFPQKGVHYITVAMQMVIQ